MGPFYKVTDMDDDEELDERERRKQRALAESRELLRRTDPERKRDQASTLPPRELAETLIGSGPEDRVAAWKRRADERTRQRQVAKDELIYKRYEGPQPAAADTRTSDDAWNRWLDARLEQEREITIAIVGEVVAKLRAERNDERSADVAAEFAKIWASITEAHKSIVELSRERASERDRAIDMPSPLSRRAN